MMMMMHSLDARRAGFANVVDDACGTLITINRSS